MYMNNKLRGAVAVHNNSGSPITCHASNLRKSLTVTVSNTIFYGDRLSPVTSSEYFIQGPDLAIAVGRY